LFYDHFENDQYKRLYGKNSSCEKKLLLMMNMGGTLKGSSPFSERERERERGSRNWWKVGYLWEWT
jgi:hypothetical protein